MNQQRIVLLSAAGLASALLLGACGSSMDNASSSGTSPTSVAPVATSAASEPATGSGHLAVTTTLMARAVEGLGSVVTDDRGMTLYRYDKDEAHPSKWTCSGTCTKTWMPVMVQDSVKTMGVEKSLLGTVHRDGRTQLTLGGWPLYRYMGDTAAGQANGQAADGMWYAVTPSGGKSVR
ncbi:hypothetical protein [Streptomyces sp. HUAS TT20]|uniref:hypothetical protein n=1 Tax=Streptomyces sp. HUAS TT20 TaxID=3447509 RepID=UPI0021D8C118|nr:hypothetical protein [Streptomyces sp. HUAS 15-9]UXY31843.1 hypothetical protein N8I87_38390 [Streptomyces sp. HUAS 15-9]